MNVFRYGDSLIARDGATEIHLGPCEADLLAILAKHLGRVVSRETCGVAIWGVRAIERSADGCYHRLAWVVTRLRLKVKPTGLTIDSIVHRGLCLNGDITCDWSVR